MIEDVGMAAHNGNKVVVESDYMLCLTSTEVDEVVVIRVWRRCTVSTMSQGNTMQTCERTQNRIRVVTSAGPRVTQGIGVLALPSLVPDDTSELDDMVGERERCGCRWSMGVVDG